MLDSNVESVVSVVEVGGNHPLRMKRIIGENVVVNYIKWCGICIKKNCFISSRQYFVGDNCLANLMPNERSLNIDTEIDFKMAEFILGGDK